jgi:type IV pilus assembly protein PilX
MKMNSLNTRQSGVALVVALLFLLVVTIISVTAANNSALGLKMAANMNDAYASFQSAEAGIFGALGLARTANDPFAGVDEDAPFAAFSAGTHPLRNLPQDPNSVRVNIFVTAADTQCPRLPDGTSSGIFSCDYYRMTSEHSVPQLARTKVELGVVKTIIGSSVN